MAEHNQNKDMSTYGILKNRSNYINNEVNKATTGARSALGSGTSPVRGITQGVDTSNVYGRTAQDQQLKQNDWWDNQLTYYSQPKNAMDKRNSVYDIRDAMNQGAQRGYEYQTQPQFRGTIDNYLDRVSPYRNEEVNDEGIPLRFLGNKPKYFAG